MEPLEILKITAKSSPTPTVVALIVYLIYPQIIGKSSSETVLIVISLLTFLTLLALLSYSAYKKEKHKTNTLSGNSINDVETVSGDVFIGNKNYQPVDSESISGNTIEDVKTQSGDVFIGQKK